MKKLLLAILSIVILNGCTRMDEYDADHKAYQKCLEMEPYIDDYVKYLPEHIQKEMENNND